MKKEQTYKEIFSAHVIEWYPTFVSMEELLHNLYVRRRFSKMKTNSFFHPHS